jgi:hypothetical protein
MYNFDKLTSEINSDITSVERQYDKLSLQIKQLEKMQALMQSIVHDLGQKDKIIKQLRDEVNSLQQQREYDFRNIENVVEITRQSIDALTQSNKEKAILIQVEVASRRAVSKFAEHLELKTKVAAENNAKFLEEKAKVESARLQLSDFIDSHPDLEDINILIQIKEVLGEDLEPQVDIV